MQYFSQHYTTKCSVLDSQSTNEILGTVYNVIQNKLQLQ